MRPSFRVHFSARLFGVAVSALLLGNLLVAVPAGAGDSTPACALLDDAEAMASISGPGEVALLRHCGLLDDADGAAQVPTATALGTDVLVNDRSTDSYPAITQSETTVAVSGSTVLVGFNDSGEFEPNFDVTGYARSTDDGATWTDMGAPTTPLDGIAAAFGDPVLAADFPRSAGETAVFYFANLGLSTSGLSNIAVHKTTDGGSTWVSAADASPLAGSAEFQDKEWLAVDRREFGVGAGNVYACWRRFGGGGGIQFSRSADGGATFQQMPANLSTNPLNVQGCSVVVSPLDGRLYVAWRDGNTSPATIRLRSSSDFGLTFGPEVVVGSAERAETVTQCQRALRTVFLDSEPAATTRAIRSSSFPSLAVDPTNGEVYVSWHRAALPGGSLADIAFARSTDGGATFSSPVRVNSAVTGQQFFASMAVNGAGKIGVIYYSTQNSPSNRLIDVYEAVSFDGGLTWGAAERVTDVSFDRPMTNPNFDLGIAPCYMGDYNGMAASLDQTNETLYMAWGDNRLDGDVKRAGVQPDPDIRFDQD